MEKIVKIIYIAGVVLDCHPLLAFGNESMPNVYCHHMTVQYGEIDGLPEFLGTSFTFKSAFKFYDEKAVALSGEVDSPIIKKIMRTVGQSAHITICTAEGVKPVYSNDLLKTGKSEPVAVEVGLRLGAYALLDNDTKTWIFEK